MSEQDTNEGGQSSADNQKKSELVEKLFEVYIKALSKDGSNPHLRLTIEGIDSTKGYIKENSVACCLVANNIKSLWEQPNIPIDNKLMLKMLLKLNGKRNEKESSNRCHSNSYL